MSLFTTVISKKPKRNAFDLSFENLLTQEFGEIIPISCKEILPGDTFRQRSEVVVKTAPMLAPIYSRIDLYLHYFFVPLRLLQTDFEDFITGGIDGTHLPTSLDGSGADITPIYAKLGDMASRAMPGIANGSLEDYFGIPTITSADVIAKGITALRVNLYPFAAYQKIYSDWYRDELLDSYEFEPIAGGEVSSTKLQELMTKRYRSWKKDYFTSARPNTQLGAPIPIPVSGSLSSDGPFRLGNNVALNITSTIPKFYSGGNVEDLGTGSDPRFANSFGTVDASDLTSLKSGSQLKYVDGISLETAGVNVNDLRRSLRLQQWMEKNMRGGNRYIENIYHHFGVRSSDARLQRSQLLGGRKVPIVVSEVVQTSAQQEDHGGNDTTALGQLAGKGNSVASTQYIKWHAEEHGFIICLASIMPHASYSQGLPRMFWRMSMFDYAWPLFGNLGEQEIFNGELFLNQSGAEGTFGYQSRYADMKFSVPETHGSFRSTMNFWHNGRLFATAPALNNDFVRLTQAEASSQNRIFPTLGTGYGHFYLHAYHDIKVIRALPKYGIPSI